MYYLGPFQLIPINCIYDQINNQATMVITYNLDPNLIYFTSIHAFNSLKSLSITNSESYKTKQRSIRCKVKFKNVKVTPYMIFYGRLND